MNALVESTVRSLASEQSFERGREYYNSGAIYNTVRQGNILLADSVGRITGAAGTGSASPACLFCRSSQPGNLQTHPKAFRHALGTA